MMSRRAKLIALILVGATILVGAAILSGTNPVALIDKMVISSFTNPVQASKMLEKLMPMLFLGTGVYLSLRAGLFNIGAEGQFMVGGIVAAGVAPIIPGPGGMVAAMVMGTIGGALWALPAGLLKAYRGAHEVISTIMLNNIASLVISALLAGPMLAPGESFPATRELDASSRIPDFLTLQIGNGVLRMNLGLIVAIVVVIFFTKWLKRSVAGYELCATGLNPRAAEFAGVDAKKIIWRSMAASGALCGFAGSLQLMAHAGRFTDGFSGGYGFDALGVAMLAGLQPLAIFPSALLFAVLNNGSTAVQFLGVPKGISGVVLAILVICFAGARSVGKRGAHED